MGGSVKNVASSVGRGISGLVTLGGSEIARNNLNKNNIVNRVLQAPGTIVTGGLNGGFSGSGQSNPYITGPFSLDPEQLAGDQASIKSLGEKQYGETTNAIDTAGKSAQDYAAQTFQRMLPGLAEDYNAGHLLNSTGYQQEAARQASNLSQDVASQVAQQKLGALTARQGFDTGAMQRGLSLEDFVNQANVAKTIGAQYAPQVNNGKGTTVSGLGAGAAAGAPFGPWGSAIGAGAGALIGSNKGGK